MAHRLFSIPELCDCVAEVIPEYNEDFRGGVDPQGPHRKTLVALALVSRTFKDSALDILWKQLTDFIPIARLFPKHVVALTDSGLWDTANAMDPEKCLPLMKPEELAVARGYIRRVRNISFREMTAVTYRILGLVAALGSPPFHSLRHLYWKGVTTEVAVRIKPYLLRSLNSVSMSFMLWDPRVALEFAAQLQALPQLCPHLTYLMLDAPNPIKRHSDALPIQRSTMQAIPKLRLLKTFKSMDLPFATQLLSALSPLTRLETIQLMFEDEAPALPLINNDAFPALETAIIDGTFKACAQFVAYLRPIVPSRLITISLNICDEPSPRDLLKLGKSVRDVLGGSLKQFRLGGPAGMAGLAAHITNAPNAKKTFDRIILRPLYDCKHLIYLTVPIWNDFSEKDEDLLRQAQEALPESKKVNLGPLVLVGPDPVLGIPTNLPIKFVHITAGGEMTEISLAGNGGDVVPGPEPEQAGQD